MPPEVICPSCQHCFPWGGDAVCPRCGAALARTEVRPAQGDIRAKAPAAAPLPTVPCPACGEQIMTLCLICPHCGEALRGRYRIHLEGADDGAPRAPSGVLRAWAAFGAVCVVLWLAVTLGTLCEGDGTSAGAYARWGAAPLLGAAVGVPLLVSVRSRGDVSWRVYLVYTLASLGWLFPLALVAGCFLSCLGVGWW
jgi:hypothetical protein